MTGVYVSGAFDDLQSRDIRLLQEAARLGPVTVALWADEYVAEAQEACKFPFEERRYVLEAIRFVERVVPGTVIPNGGAARAASFDSAGRTHRLRSGSPSGSAQDAFGTSTFGIPAPREAAPDLPVWAVLASEATEDKVDFCRRYGVRLVSIPPEDLTGFPLPSDLGPSDGNRKRAVVTGCYDWFHSGHVRFFEECSQLGDLYVVVGHDENVRLLKGEGHPLLGEDERRYMVGSCRYVRRALISSGTGWMDAEPEIALIRPHMYVVNEDGDKPEKRAFCTEHGIEYVVLKRTPKEGLPRRSSTDLRGY